MKITILYNCFISLKNTSDYYCLEAIVNRRKYILLNLGQL